MNKEEKYQRLKDYSEYMSEGLVEAGKDNNLDVQVTNIIKHKQGKMPPSVFVIQAFSRKLSTKKHYSKFTHLVLHYFISLTEFENFLSVDIKTISEDLDISEESVKRATKQLVEDKIVIKVPHPSDKRRIDYFLNPLGMWKGKTLKRDKFLEKAKKDNLQLDMFPKDE